jgi:hypothetical protein
VVIKQGPSVAEGRGAGQRLRAAWSRSVSLSSSRPAARHLLILAGYLAAGIAVTWPRAAYLVQGRLPNYGDVSSYVWDLWWVAHQVTHLGNPFLTHDMAAPVGVQLGFDTLIPLLGLVMTPVTLALGPSASLSLLTIVVPGLASYTMYRAARLWLRSQTGAIAAGALFGLSSMLDWQDWYHLQISAGVVLLPVTLEAAVWLRRSTVSTPGATPPDPPPPPASPSPFMAGKPTLAAGTAFGRLSTPEATRPGSSTPGATTPGSIRRQAVILGLVLGASVLINQEMAIMCLILAALVLLPWLLGTPALLLARLRPLALGALVAAVLASPQLIAMGQQIAAGGAAVSPHLLALSDANYGTALTGLFAPSPRAATFGLPVPSANGPVGEGMPGYGVLLTVLAAGGLAAAWRRRSAWGLAGLWLGCAALALGVKLYVGWHGYLPLRATLHGVPVSQLMPYTWLIRIPGMAAFRDAARLALLGLTGAALLAGSAVDWLRDHARPLIAGVAALGILEAGWSGSPGPGAMPTALPALDRPIAADRSGSVVLDVPFGLRGGPPLYGSRLANAPLLIATADGHPRAISYTARVPAPTIAAIARHPFFAQLVRVQDGVPLAPRLSPARGQVSAADLAEARADLRRLNIGWALVWPEADPTVTRYLIAAGFRPDYRADGVAVYRFAG